MYAVVSDRAVQGTLPHPTVRRLPLPEQDAYVRPRGNFALPQSRLRLHVVIRDRQCSNVPARSHFITPFFVCVFSVGPCHAGAEVPMTVSYGALVLSRLNKRDEANRARRSRSRRIQLRLR